MGYQVRTRDEHFQNDGTPKRILALDGGGLRGILTLGFLGRIEALLAVLFLVWVPGAASGYEYGSGGAKGH